MCKTVQTYNQVVALPEITLMEGSFCYWNGELGQISEQHGIWSQLLRGAGWDFQITFISFRFDMEKVYQVIFLFELELFKDKS